MENFSESKISVYSFFVFLMVAVIPEVINKYVQSGLSKIILVWLDIEASFPGFHSERKVACVIPAGFNVLVRLAHILSH